MASNLTVAAVILTVIVLLGCDHAQTSGAKASRFIESQQQVIDKHKKILTKMGRMSEDFGDAHLVLGRYEWYGSGDGYFGAYAFYEPSFEQAKRGWFLKTAYVIEGNNELWVSDQDIKFDDSIIGYTLPPMHMSWVENGKHKGEYFTAHIVGVKEEGRTLLLDRRAPHHAEQWHISIVPKDWQELCNCTNNFHPPFADGQPIVKDANKSQ